MDPIPGDRRPPVTGFAIATLVIGVISLILRAWAKFITRARFQWDDALIILGFLCSIGNCAISFWGVQRNFGKHAPEVRISLFAFQEVELAVEVFFNVGISAVKLAMLVYYLRLFKHVRSFHIAVWITGVLCILWALGTTITGIVWFYDPLHANILGSNMASAVTELSLDIIIIILPQPLLWNLNMKIWKKTRLIVMFLAAYCVIGCSVYRTINTSMAFHSAPQDYVWYTASLVIIIDISIPVAIFCVSIPIFWPLFKRAYEEGFRALFRRQNSEEIAFPLDSETPRGSVTQDTEDPKDRASGQFTMEEFLGVLPRNHV